MSDGTRQPTEEPIPNDLGGIELRLRGEYSMLHSYQGRPVTGAQLLTFRSTKPRHYLSPDNKPGNKPDNKPDNKRIIRDPDEETDIPF